MLKATATHPHVHHPIATITLDATARHRRRMVMTTDRMANGSTLQFLLDLPKAQLLRHGSAILLEDGSEIEVRAAPEPLYEIRGRDIRHLLTLAWQLGNRHLPSQIMSDHILIRTDHVIKSMLEGLGASVLEVEAPFDPEGGAYGDERGHDHGHSHDTDHHHNGHGHQHQHSGDGDHDH